MALTDQEAWIPVETFGDRLRMLRKHLDLTTDEIGVRCTIPGPTWSSWENGAKPRRMDERVEQISEALGVDRAWLMWGVRTGSRCTLLPGPDGQMELALGIDAPALVAVPG